MKKSQIIKISVLLVIFIAISFQLVLAGGLQDRMKKRAPAIVDLKKKGIVGESNRGYLGFVSSARAQEALVAAENKDRKTYYSHVAKREGITLADVEKIQGKRKVKIVASGQYFQAPDGKWVKK